MSWDKNKNKKIKRKITEFYICVFLKYKKKSVLIYQDEVIYLILY